MNELQVLKLKMITNTYSLLSTTFEIRWLVVGGCWVGSNIVDGLVVGGR